MKRTVEVKIPKEQLDRTAASFIRAANEFSCRISIAQGGRSVNAKSLLGFLSLMQEGGSVDLSAEGAEAEKALETLAGILEAK